MAGGARENGTALSPLSGAGWFRSLPMAPATGWFLEPLRAGNAKAGVMGLGRDRPGGLSYTGGKTAALPVGFGKTV